MHLEACRQVSITDLIASKGLQALHARAATAYGTMGIVGKDMQRCIEYTVRYGLGAARLGHEKTPVELYKAIVHIACHQVADLLAGTATSRRNQAPASSNSSSLSYWVEKVCEVIGIETWLDDSLDKWFLDTHHPLADVLVQTSRRRVMDQLAACVATGSPVDRDDLILAIIHELQAKFPALARFTRHLPGAVEATIEHDVLGIPLVDKVEPVGITPAMVSLAATATTATTATPDDITADTASRAYPTQRYIANYPDTTTTTNTQMR